MASWKTGMIKLDWFRVDMLQNSVRRVLNLLCQVSIDYSLSYIGDFRHIHSLKLMHFPYLGGTEALENSAQYSNIIR